MSNTSPVKEISGTFLSEVDPDGRMNLTACLQCGRCSSGCTMRLETDILPHQMNRLVAMGMRERVLSSKAIWLCASCQTCVSRCPMNVNTPAMIDKLREMAASQQGETDTERIRVFNKAMLGSMQRFGRVYELGLMGEFKLRTRDFFSDLAKFPTMLLKRKISLIPPMVKGRGAVAAIFGRIKARREKH